MDSVFIQFLKSVAYFSIRVCLFSLAFMPNLLYGEDSFEGPQFTIPGFFTGDFQLLNNVPVGGLDFTGDNLPDVYQPCSCREQAPYPNGQNLDNRFFNDQIIIATGISGEQWLVDFAFNAFHPQTLQPITVNTPIPEVGESGIYILPVLIMEGAEFQSHVYSPVNYPDLTFNPITYSCYYPDPLIENLEPLYCQTDADFELVGSVTTDAGQVTMPLIPESEEWLITRQEDGATFQGSTFSPATLGQGHYVIQYTVNAGDSVYFAGNKTGCTATVEEEVVVWGGSFACNGSINVSLANSCEVVISPSILLANDPLVTDFFRVEVLVLDGSGNNLGDTIPAEFAGQQLLAVLHDDCTGNFCTTDLVVNDVTAPTLTIPADTTLSCLASEAPEFTGFASAEDCLPVEITYSDNVVETECGDPKIEIFRTWTATDPFENATSETQKISIARGGPTQFLFPPNVNYSCEAYGDDPTITDPGVDKAGMPTLVMEPRCGLLYGFEDDTVRLCGNPNSSFVILREWTVFDLCGSEIFLTDAAGNSNLQFIRVLDETGPIINADPVSVGATLPPQVNGLDGCSSVGFIPAPNVVDACNDFTVRIITPLGEAIYANGQNGAEGGFIPEPGLQLGTHSITYEAEDACGNISTLMVELTVIDELPPILLCDNFVTVTLAENGEGRVFPANIDEGSRDDCCLDIMQVKLEEEPDSLYRDFVQFFCVTDTVPVTLQVVDCAGNVNQCVTSVYVQDILPPVVISESIDTIVSCIDNYDSFLDQNFSAPTFFDNCTYEVAFSVVETIDNCGVGFLERTWTATDNNINPPAIATQIVTLEATFDYFIEIPADTAVECNEIGFESIALSSFGCDSLTYTVTESTFVSAGDPSCYKILRTYEITNWCEYSGSGNPTVIQRWDDPNDSDALANATRIRSDGQLIYRLGPDGEEQIGPSTGLFQYQQIIEVFDNTPPGFAFVEPAPFCTPTEENAQCFGEVTYSFELTDNCSDTFSINYALNAFLENIVGDIYGSLTAEGNGRYTISGTYPVGQHSFEIFAFDECGGETTFSMPFEVIDCTSPILTCGTDIVFNLDSEGLLTLSPADLVSFAGDNCTTVDLSFHPDSLDVSESFDCDSLGVFDLTIWATDAAGNQTSCPVQFVVGDELEVCLKFLNVAGRISSESGIPIRETSVQLTGMMTLEGVTDIDGSYQFLDVPEGPNYKLTPGNNLNHKNGVSTLDLILISKHIIGVTPLSSPYKIIAADVNQSGAVSTLDLIKIRRLILGLDAEFSENTSWRFVEESYTFLNPENPLAESFPETVIIDYLDKDTIINFIGMKIGDVNESFDPTDQRSARPQLKLLTSNLHMEEGSLYELEFAPETKDLIGYQFTLAVDLQKADLLGFKPLENMGSQHFNNQFLNLGLLGVSWDQSNLLYLPKFNMKIKAKCNCTVQEILQINSRLVRPEVYREEAKGDIEIYDLTLGFEKDELINVSNRLIIRPNPFRTNVTIQYETPYAEQAEWLIFDVNGKIIQGAEVQLEKGIHQFEFDKKDFPASGTYLFQLKSKHFTTTRKIILLDN